MIACPWLNVNKKITNPPSFDVIPVFLNKTITAGTELTRLEINSLMN